MHPNVLALHVLKPKENRHLPYSSPHSQGSFSDITLLNWLASWFAIADVVVPSLFWATSRCCCCCHCSCSMIIGKTGSAAVGLLFALIFRLWSEISNPREAKERKIGFKFERSGLCCCERVVAIKQIRTASFTITTKTKRSAWWMGGFIEREAGKMDREKLCGDTNKRLTRWNLGSRQLLLLVGKLEWEAFPLSLSFSIFAYFFPFLSPFHPSCLLMLQQKACCCRPVEERLRWLIQRTQAQLEPGEKLSKRANEQTPAQETCSRKKRGDQQRNCALRGKAYYLLVSRGSSPVLPRWPLARRWAERERESAGKKITQQQLKER